MSVDVGNIRLHAKHGHKGAESDASRAGPSATFKPVVGVLQLVVLPRSLSS